jgi:hypothetical protein
MDKSFASLTVSVEIPADCLMPLLYLLNKEVQRIKTVSPETFDNSNPGSWADSIKRTTKIVAAAHSQNLVAFN